MSPSRSVNLLAVGRLALALVVLAAGLVAVVPHRDALMWRASVIASEGGHWLAVASVVLLFGWRRSGLHKASVVLAIIGIVLLVTPVSRSSSPRSTAVTSNLALGRAHFLKLFARD